MLEGEAALHDVAALKPIVEAAGGVLLPRGGEPLVTGWTGPAMSANRNLAEPLRRAMGF
jgi:fructose-1,6-bisphosphatase/inositol monophosphatase family enzyme